MPEANVLYSVTAVVVVGLVAWVAVVLKTAKEPWSRPGVAQPRTDDVPVEPGVAEPAEAKADDEPAKTDDEPAKTDDEPAKAETSST